MHTVFARYGDEFGTNVSGADFEIGDVLELIPIVERLSGTESHHKDTKDTKGPETEIAMSPLCPLWLYG